MTDYLERALSQREQTEFAEEREPAEALKRVELTAPSYRGAGETEETPFRAWDEEKRGAGLWARWKSRLSRGVFRGREQPTAWERLNGGATASQGAESETRAQGSERTATARRNTANTAEDGARLPSREADRERTTDETALKPAEAGGVAEALSAVASGGTVGGDRVSVTVRRENEGADLRRVGEASPSVIEEQSEWGVLSHVLTESIGAERFAMSAGRAGVTSLLRQVERAERGAVDTRGAGRVTEGRLKAEEAWEAPLTVGVLDRAVERDARRYGGDFSLL